MSLQVWLPLDGSLENKGLLDFSIINKGSMVGFLNNGKIGQCLGQTTVSSAGRYLDIYNESLDNILTFGAFTVSCWIRLTNNVSSGFPICLGNRETSATRNSLYWNRGSTQGGSGTARFVVDCDTNGHSIIGTDSIANEENPQWHHLAFTIDKTNVRTNENEYNGTLYLKCYVDGVKTLDSSFTYSKLSYDFKVVSGNKICFDTYVANFNDFRFYDHILSDKEVKEISKGLILHYKLDDPYVIQDKIIYDSSGYRYDGTVNDGVSIDLNTIKYNACYAASGTTSVITTTHKLDFLGHSNPFTISLWAYCDDWTNASASAAKFLLNKYQGTAQGGFRIYCSTGANRFRFYWANEDSTAVSIYFNASGALTSGWHLFTATFDGTIVTTYRDGVKYTSNNSTSIKNTSSTIALTIGSGTSTLPGKYSDVRIYCTALSADDIKELYNTSASIDNKGNIHAREFIEENKSSITKQGQYINSEISEMKNAGMAGVKNYTQASISSQLSTGNYLYEI